MASAKRVLGALAPDLELVDLPFGGSAIRSHGDSLPAETLEACRSADAVLKAPVGDPEFDAAEVRPEQGILRLRGELDVYTNLRPASQGDVDMVIVRELVGGLYFGAKGVREDGTVFDTCEYHPSQVERIARRAFELARSRRGRLTSVDKANILETSRMWRRVVAEVAADYPDVEVEDMLVDNAAMQLASSPEQFDVIVTEASRTRPRCSARPRSCSSTPSAEMPRRGAWKPPSTERWPRPRRQTSAARRAPTSSPRPSSQGSPIDVAPHSAYPVPSMTRAAEQLFFFPAFGARSFTR